jgi:hypothetical protein
MTIWSDAEEEELVWVIGNVKGMTWPGFPGDNGTQHVSLQPISPCNDAHFSRPAIPYSQIIRQALEESPRGKLLLKEIYAWFESFHPYYTQENKGWKVLRQS